MKHGGSYLDAGIRPRTPGVHSWWRILSRSALDRETKKPRGFAFITFADKKEAKAAIKAMNKSEFKGRKISVEESSSGGRSKSKRRTRR